MGRSKYRRENLRNPNYQKIKVIHCHTRRYRKRRKEPNNRMMDTKHMSDTEVLLEIWFQCAEDFLRSLNELIVRAFKMILP